MSAPTDEDREEEPMTESGLADARGILDPVAVGPGDDDAGSTESVEPGQGGNGAAGDASPAPALAGADASLLALVDRLTAVLERSELGELEVAVGRHHDRPAGAVRRRATRPRSRRRRTRAWRPRARSRPRPQAPPRSPRRPRPSRPSRRR